MAMSISGSNRRITGATEGRSECGHRLTLTSGTPVTTADVTVAGTLYLTPYKGNGLALYDGAEWAVYAVAELSKVLTGLLTASRPHDVFAYLNAGVPTLDAPLAWTSDTARATVLAYQDGVLVKSGDATRRYLGTLYSTGTGTTEDSEANRFLWNYYNRVRRSMTKQGNAATWTYATSTWRQANNSSANQLNFVAGLAEDSVDATVETAGFTSLSTTRVFYVGVNLNSVVATPNSQARIDADNAKAVPGVATLRAAPTAGKNYLAWMEYAAGADTQTFLGQLLGRISGSVLA